MKKYIFLLIATLLLTQLNTTAQNDSRNRTPATVVADALAQLPVNDNAKFKRIMAEVAATGSEGVMQIVSTMNFRDNNFATAEYAIGGLTDYVMSSEGAKYRDGLRKGLIQAIESSSYVPQKHYLITALSTCATPDDVPTLLKYAADADLRDCVLTALCSIQGIDSQMADFVRSSDAPRIQLAKIIMSRQLSGCDDLLASWLPGADATTTAAIYSAMAATGSDKALATLSKAAQTAEYAPEKTHATDAYIALLDRLSDSSKDIVAKAAKKLAGADEPASRCAGLRLMLKTAGDNGTAIMTKALRDRDAQYRNTALEYGLEYCGTAATDAMANALPRLSYDAQTDVVRWLGIANATNHADIVAKNLSKSSGPLLSESMKTAARLGGTSSLEGLTALLGTENAEEATAALLTFNGDITQSMIAALSSDNPTTVKNALRIVSQRSTDAAFDKVIELTASNDKEISDAALEALGHVAGPEKLGRICSMLDRADADAAAKLQQSIIRVNERMDRNEAFATAEKAMKASATPERYYRIVARTNTDDAIALLRESSGNEAQNALLEVNNTKMLPILLDMAADKRKGEQKDRVLARYLQLASTAQATPVERYLMLVKGMESGASTALGNRYLKAIGSTQTIQALGYMRRYYDTPEYADVAAECIKDLVAAHDDFNGGRNVKEMLNQAISTYVKQVDNHDAGYAIDQIKGLLAKTAASGYALSTGSTKMNRKGYWKMQEKFENFILSFDWKSNDSIIVSLRDMPVLVFDNAKGVRLHGEGQQWHKYNNMGDWNTADIKVVDDRVNVSVNGRQLIANGIITNPKEGKSINVTGGLGFQAANDSLVARYTRIRNLPSTPVFVLSEEESEQGFEVLFDGRSLEKWQGNTTGYVPQNGNIYVTANYGGSGNLYTKERYSDFVLRFEFCFDRPGVNNGVGLRTNIGTDAAYDGMEIQILDHDDPIYKGLQAYQQHGAVYGIIVPEHVVFDKPGTWYSEEIRAVGDNITVTVNGKVILDGNIREACKGHNVAPDGSEHNPYTVDHKNHPGLFNKEGHISFCGHGPGIMIRNVRVLDLAKNKKKR